MSPDKKYSKRTCFLHLKLSRQSVIAKLFIRWIVFCKLWSGPFIKLKFYYGQHQPLERVLNWYISSNTHLNSCETVSLNWVEQPTEEVKDTDIHYTHKGNSPDEIPQTVEYVIWILFSHGKYNSKIPSCVYRTAPNFQWLSKQLVKSLV